MSQKEKGVTLLELILVLAIIAIITVLAFYEKQTELEQIKARQVGGLLFQYNNAVRARIAKGDLAASQTTVGSAWLKSSDCGGPLTPGAEYLPCEFPAADVTDPIPFGRLTLTTTIKITGTAPIKKIAATTTSTPFVVSDKGIQKTRADLSGLATLSAAAALVSGLQSNAVGISPVNATTDSSYRSDPLTARITVLAGNTAESDVWLRTDGGNSMHSNLNFDSSNPSFRNITGASRIQNIAGEALSLGNGSGMTPATSSNVVVDSSAEVLGDFRVRKSASIDGNVTAQGVVTADAVISKHQVQGSVFIDADDNAYRVDPSATSTMRDLRVENSGHIKYLSSDETTVNSALSVGGYIYLNGLASQGGSCLANGQMGSDATGKTLSCQGGVWRSNGMSVNTPVVLDSRGFVSSYSKCLVSPKVAMITGSGPGNINIQVNGVVVARSMDWGGKYSDVAGDGSVSAMVGAGSTFCFNTSATTGMAQSSGILLTATYLE